MLCWRLLHIFLLESSLYDFEGSKILEVRSLLVKTKSQISSNPLYAYDGLHENIVMNHVYKEEKYEFEEAARG